MAGESLIMSQRRGSRHCGIIFKLSVECFVVYLIDYYIFEYYHSFLGVFFQAFEDLSKLMVKVSSAVLCIFTLSWLCWFKLDVRPVPSSSVDSASGLAEWCVLSCWQAKEMVELSKSIANKIKDKQGDITEDEVRTADRNRRKAVYNICTCSNSYVTGPPYTCFYACLMDMHVY